ncbi:acyl-CoA dehydrogenase family protein [Solwaraspora sp. WMMD791]|uniref:acyl-CoA dehydrogenase family protein n=1 Tax=Solwaraspora sp. WMMD791 TaxID=3016086 RepID=UPI00249CD29D|nr:acyl-CoA dehydrogenase family protein [Solwaraspora sp. WMMD791]WFE29599.1 acyl-CoA dehydrogenase family protein [Solwaraspora sp. WMMD791]
MTAALAWLEPLRCSIPEIDGKAWDDLEVISDVLARRVSTAPPSGDPARAQWLLDLRRDLACDDRQDPPAPGGLVRQALAQFCAGTYDLDLRDVTGAGHGAMILADAAATVRDTWRTRLSRGDLVGIAATERHGGSRIQEITTQARSDSDGRWHISGEKCWVSRIVESAGFVVFFRDPDDRITAAVIDAAAHGLARETLKPSGLGGWSWGVLRLHDVSIDPATDLLGPAGGGMGVFRRHFARFRPLVTATALGTAAGVHTFVAEALAARRKVGVLPRVRDNALITLGRTHAQIVAALLAAITTIRLAASDHPHADLFARVGKAAGVDTAHRAVTDLAPLLGAYGFQQSSPVAKARADLTGMLYADGVHDSLYRSGGTTLLRAPYGLPT